MADRKPNLLASKVYELAEQFARFRGRAEYFWCDDEEVEGGDKDLQFLSKDKESLTALAREIAGMRGAKSASVELSQFAKAVEDFWLTFHEQWGGITRKTKLKKTRGIEPEQTYDRACQLLKESPMQNGAWEQVQAAIQAAVANLDDGLKACARLSGLLAAEMYPTFAGGQLNRSPKDERAWFTGGFSTEVKQALVDVGEHFPLLSPLDLDLSDADDQRVQESISRLWRQIGDALRGPAGQTYSAKPKLEKVSFDTPPFTGYEIPIDPVRLRQFRQLGRIRQRNPSRGSDKGISWAKWEYSSGFFAVVQLAATDPSVDQMIGKMKFGPQLARLLLAIHVRVMAAQNLKVKLEERWLAAMIWGAQTQWPRNWRTSLAKSIGAAAILSVVLESGLHRARLIQSVKPVEGGFVVTASPDFLGKFSTLAQKDGILALIKSRPDPKARITDNEIAEFLQGMKTDLSDLSKKEIKQLIRNKRTQDAQKPSIQNIGRTGRLWNLFVPGVLGNPSVCAEMGPLAIVLFRERTRSRKPVETAMVPGWSGKAQIQCPLLDGETPYAAFAANGANRRGRGYKLATWAERLDTDVDGFLKMLTAARARLGLVVAGLDSDGSWLDLDQIRAADARVRDRINLRIYTRGDDFITRWCEVFGWSTVGGNPPGTTGAVPGETAELASILRNRGIRAVAKAIGIDHSNLAKILKGKRKPRAKLMAKIRDHVRQAQVVGGKGPGTIFVNCPTNLDFALAYRRLGWSVIPVQAKGGRVKWKQYQTTLPTVAEIQGWWRRWPEAGIGLILGPASGVFAIDVDGQEGYDALIAQLGAEPEAPKAMSGSGGPHKMHFFFRHPAFTTKAKVTPWHEKLEFRGHAGLIVLAPSVHKSGNQYRWGEGMGIEDRALPELPEKVRLALEALAAKPRAAASANPVPAPVAGQLAGIRLSSATAEFLAGKRAEGPGWNKGLFNAACELNGRGVPLATASPALLQGAKPRNDQERTNALATIQSAYSQPRKLGVRGGHGVVK